MSLSTRELQITMKRVAAHNLLALLLLAADAHGFEVGSSRVHFLYFLSSLLLLKTALSQQGRMSNVAAQVWHE